MKARRARCNTCGCCWGVSVRQEIPKSGYECPLCAGKRKRAQQVRTAKAQEKYIYGVIIHRKQEVSQI